MSPHIPPSKFPSIVRTTLLAGGFVATRGGPSRGRGRLRGADAVAVGGQVRDMCAARMSPRRARRGTARKGAPRAMPTNRSPGAASGRVCAEARRAGVLGAAMRGPVSSVFADGAVRADVALCGPTPRPVLRGARLRCRAFVACYLRWRGQGRRRRNGRRAANGGKRPALMRGSGPKRSSFADLGVIGFV